MRLFVACSNCDRKYKASADKLGNRFRCHCGQVLEVREPKGHEAAVIRCSSCGSARQEGRNRCGYCDADFTIHERDLHTVCPKCLARVSDRCKFCPHCGTRLAGEQMIDDISQLACPLCGPEKLLSHRRLGQEQVSVLECSRCAGLWLGKDAFEQLRDRVLSEAAMRQTLTDRKPEAAPLRRQIGPTYRNCIYCGRHMHRQQYARGSGVVIDICSEHGLWFDAQELQQTLAWIARGGTRGKPLPYQQPSADAPSLKRPRRPDRPRGPQTVPWSRGGDFMDDLVGGLFGTWF